MSKRHEGGCVCGSVRYVTQGDPLRVTVCHCTWCQKRTGTAFAVEPVFNEDQVEITGGPLTKYRHISNESGRWLDLEFCPKCGTNIGLTLEWRPGARIIDAGTFAIESCFSRHHGAMKPLQISFSVTECLRTDQVIE